MLALALPQVLVFEDFPVAQAIDRGIDRGMQLPAAIPQATTLDVYTGVSQVPQGVLRSTVNTASAASTMHSVVRLIVNGHVGSPRQRRSDQFTHHIEKPRISGRRKRLLCTASRTRP